MLQLDFQLKLQDIEIAIIEIQRLKLLKLKFLQNGFWGALLSCFFIYIVFSPPLTRANFLRLLILLILFTCLFAFASYRYFNQFIESTLNRKGEPTTVTLTINKGSLIYQTPIVTFHLQLKHFENIYITNNFYHLDWSAVKAHYLRQIGYLSIPKRAFSSSLQQEEFIDYFRKHNVRVK